jgi:hypothetical protein
VQRLLLLWNNNNSNNTHRKSTVVMRRGDIKNQGSVSGFDNRKQSHCCALLSLLHRYFGCVGFFFFFWGAYVE